MSQQWVTSTFRLCAQQLERGTLPPPQHRNYYLHSKARQCKSIEYWKNNKSSSCILNFNFTFIVLLPFFFVLLVAYLVLFVFIDLINLLSKSMAVFPKAIVFKWQTENEWKYGHCWANLVPFSFSRAAHRHRNRKQNLLWLVE